MSREVEGFCFMEEGLVWMRKCMIYDLERRYLSYRCMVVCGNSNYDDLMVCLFQYDKKGTSHEG